MYVVVAIRTRRSDLAECPLVLLHVAGVAGRGEMPPFQREFGATVLLERE